MTDDSEIISTWLEIKINDISQTHEKIFFLKNNDHRAAFTKPMDYQCYVHTLQGIFALLT